MACFIKREIQKYVSIKKKMNINATYGSKGVYVLYKKEVNDRVHIVHKDVVAHYMFI